MSLDPKQLRILEFPDPALRRKGAPIEITDEVRAVAERMRELMHEADGLGLAAPQVGLAWRMFVTAAQGEEPARVFVNPRLSEFSSEQVVREEGCLSLPGIHVDVRRPQSVVITATDLDGNEFSLTDADLLARVWQHEYDHLDGVLIIDKMSPMDRLANRRAIRDLKAAGM